MHLIAVQELSNIRLHHDLVALEGDIPDSYNEFVARIDVVSGRVRLVACRMASS